MNMSAIELAEIKQDLARVPENKLPEVHEFVRRLIPSSRRNVQPLEGIWEGIGFEKIDDLEQELRKLRRESSEQILKKFDDWNS